MAQGEFTKEEAKIVEEELNEVMLAMPKKKRMEFIGQFNNIFLFISAAGRVAPNEEKKDERNSV